LRDGAARTRNPTSPETVETISGLTLAPREYVRASLALGATLKDVRRLDPQDDARLTFPAPAVALAAGVFLGQRVKVIRRSLIGSALFDDGSTNHNAAKWILTIDDRHGDPGIAVGVARLEMPDHRIDQDMATVWFHVHPHRRCLR